MTAAQLQTLLSERHWLIGLSRHLVAGIDEPEDLVQETYLRALRREDGVPEDHARGWLAKTARNVSQDAKRRAAARAAREREVAAQEASAAAPDEMLAFAEFRSRVAAAVMALEEPERTAVVMRFYEGISTEEIAARTEAEAGTVRQRISRALRKLRSRLDAEQEDRAWVPAALAMAAQPGLGAKVGAGLSAAFLVSAVAVVAALGILLAPGSGEVVEVLAPPLVAELNEQREPDAVAPVLVAVKTAPAETRRVATGRVGTLDKLHRGPGLGIPSTGEEETVTALAGRFVEYRDGVPLEMSLDGSVEVKVDALSGWGTVRVPLIDGAFELQLVHLDGRYQTLAGVRVGLRDPDETHFRVSIPASPSGGVFAHDDAQSFDTLGRPEAIPFGTLDAVVSLKRTVPIELYVVDEVTGMPLNHIDVYQSGRFSSIEGIDPQGTTRERLQNDGSSPVLLEAMGEVFNATRQQLIVGAKEYAWNTITVDFTRPQRWQIALKRAGGLRVRLEGERPEEAKIRLRSGGRLISERGALASETVYEHLLPGVYAVSLEEDVDPYNSPIVQASGSAEVVGGVEGQLTLRVEPPEPVATGSVVGQLHLPVELGVDGPILRVDRLSPSRSGGRMSFRVTSRELKPVPKEPGRFAFQLDELEVGRYLISLFGPGSSDEFEVTPAGVASVELATAPPVTIFASIKDELTGEDVPDITEMVWVPNDSKRHFNGQINNVERDPKTGRFEMHVPAMEIIVFAAGREHSQNVVRLLPVEGQEVKIRVSRRIPVLVELRDGGNVVPWPIAVNPRPRRTVGERRWTPWTFEAGRPRIEIPKAGTYRLEIPEFSGYKKHLPVEFEVTPGPMQTVVVELTPE